MVLHVPIAAAAVEAEAPELSEGQKALVAAKESGQRVEVVGQRSEQTTVFASTDGYTFTLEESAVPVRVSKAGGGWQDPDPTLEKRVDGSVVPKAAAPQIAFSGGGDKEPLARIARQGRSLELTWPGTLPEPKLDGASAVYANVLPDVDLRVTATVESFQHVLVVKTPEAAANEKLKKLTFGLAATGLKVEEGASGNLAAIDDDGRTVFKAPPARMWNSAGKDRPASSRAVLPGTAAPDGAAPSDPAETALSGTGTEPGQGDQVARMDVEVGEGTLSIVPDADLLKVRDAAVYPLFIDPSVTWGESERTLLRSDGYEDYAWGNGDDDQGKGAGKCGSWKGYGCGPGYVQRLYYEFSPASLKGKHVLDATFRVTEPWAFQCEPRWVDLVRTNNISSSTTWSSRPKELDLMGDRHVSAGRGDLCSPGLPNAAIEFNDNPEESNENLTPTVKDFAAGKFSRLTLQIRAHDESDTAAWKRFRNDAVLEVSFVGIPDKPSGIGLVTGSGTVCSTSESNPTIASDPTPTLTATTQTKAGGEDDAQLRIFFDVERKNTDGTWTNLNAGTNDSRPSTGYAGDGKKQIISWSTLTEGPVHRYRAWTQSFYNNGKSHLSGPSNGSTTGFCYFKVDPTAPKAPKITIGSPYTACLPNACAGRGGPGQKATFGLAPATGDTGVVSYQYKLSDMAAWLTVNGATANVPLTPQQAGTYTLWARAKDTVGRYGAWNAVDFLVAAGAGPIARYHFDEAGGVALDSATADGKDDATLGAGALRDHRGRRGLITHDATGQPLATPVQDKGLALDGVTGHASTSGPAVETRSSYTISAWARVTPGTTRTQTVLSQDGGTFGPFYVSYGADGIKDWSLRVLTVKDGAYTWNKARAKQTSPTGVWTHLTAAFDAANNKVRLYVNGAFQSEADAGTPWSATGALQIGRAQWGGGYVDYFSGVVDEVTVWQRTLTEEEIAKDAKLLISEQFAGAELIADWNPGRGVEGALVKDTVTPYGSNLTLAGGAAVTDEEIVLDGVDDAATVAGPLVDGSSSFTVTTGVTLDGAKLLTKGIGYIGQVAGQRTADGSAWGLWFELTDKQTVMDEETMEETTVPVGLWHFGRLEADGTFSSATSEETASVDSTARLTGVHDSVDGTISLYIGYSQNGDAMAYTAQIGNGEFAVGKAYAAGGWKHFLPARISDVRLWAGAMAGPAQIDAHVGD
ncbi:LamG domain-containing protein [Streptomyces californicus]|uniref:LamG domain-containing protein n=1 Tax=Streptomyces californicus TaxID=67351 RepID=UPI00296E34F9|nr:LamG domain-containing protein [Streptomyces californicus]MDW4912879.1 LamG domain-containing protein [Streptomyces californicus]